LLLFLSFVDEDIVLTLDYNGKVYRQLTKTAGMICYSAGKKEKLVYVFIHGNAISKCLFDPKVIDIEKVVLY
jgi:hypothetical protein